MSLRFVPSVTKCEVM